MIPTISTHTLTWSVTRVENQQWQRNVHFNSHAHVERDVSADSQLPDSSDFNSHAHVERDRTENTGCAGMAYFNSHAHVERDRGICKHSQVRSISTHTLTWSVTGSTSS